VKLARDTWLTFQYEVGQLVHNPMTIVFAMLQPVTYLLFFTPFLKSVLHLPTYGATFQVYVPSLFCSMGLFGGLFAGFALLGAMREGVITRFRVTPLSRVGLMLGQQLRYVVLIAFQCGIITVMALALGMRLPPANVLLALILLAMMVLLGVSISYALAIFVPSETTLANLTNGVAQPLSLLAGVLVPLSVAPLWIKDVALGNPFAWAANGMRAIFLGHIGSQVVWEAGVILLGVAGLAVVLSSRLFNRELA
jgi:ABC-2 type transport system permease protein